MKNWKYWFRVIVSFSLIILFLVKLDLSEIFLMFVKAKPIYIILAIFLLVMDRLLICYRQWVLLQRRKISIYFHELMRIYWIGDFIGFFLPGLIGGDIVKIYGLSKKIKSSHVATSNIFAERAVGILSIFCVALFGLSFRMEERVERKIMWFVVISLFISLVFIAILFSSNFGKIINKLTVHNSFISDNIQKFHQSLKWFAKYPSLIFYVFCICICVQFERIITSYVIAKSLGLDIHILDFIIFVPITFIVVMIPISIGGFGVQEVSYVYFFGLMGVGANEAFSLSLFAHLLTLLVAAPGGFLYAKGGISCAKKLHSG